MQAPAAYSGSCCFSRQHALPKTIAHAHAFAATFLIQPHPQLLLPPSSIPKPLNTSSVAARAKAPRASSGSSSTKKRVSRGFARTNQQLSKKEPRKDQAHQLVQEIDDEQQGMGPGVDAIQMRSEYQLYKDAEYKPQRWIGPVEIKSIPGRGRGLVVTEQVVPGDLLMVLPALVFLEGELGEVPDPEELHIAMLEDGLTPAQRRVLDMLYDGSEASLSAPASMTTLDHRFWSSRGKSDPQAPQISSARLLSILQNCACSDGQQDGACMTLRHQKPFSYVGLWPELSLVNHSSSPNISMVVIKDRMLVHAAVEMAPGEELLRSYLGAATTQPLPQREAEMAEAGWPGLEATSKRGLLELQVSENVREVLQDAWRWYSQEAYPRFSEANAAETLEPLKELLEEAEQIVSEVEEAVEAEPELTDMQRVMLRAAAYDSYDMLVLTDEFVNQERASPNHVLYCLELLRILAPGSESHTSVALKYEANARDRLHMAESLLRKSQSSSKRQQVATILKACIKEADLASEYCLDAYITRYGWVSSEMFESLRQGTEVYTEALEQMSLMEAEGLSETSKDYSINGVNVSVVDKVDLGGASAMPSWYQAASSSGSSDDGPSVQVMETLPEVSSSQAKGGAGWGSEVVEAEVQDVESDTDDEGKVGWMAGNELHDEAGQDYDSGEGGDGGDGGGGDD